MSGIYIHIPFCKQACVYCNFYFKVGSKNTGPLADAICDEIDLRQKEVDFNIETLYFGGGTPSFIDPVFIAEIIEQVKTIFKVTNFTELTLEANPDDISLEKLKLWKQYGITRLSIGVQSFFNEHLKWMNRAHTAAEAESCIQMATDLGFEVSIDLIFGAPNCSNEQWLQNLEKANNLPIQHISCYGLTLEENTPWKKLIFLKKYDSPDDDNTAEQFELTMNYMAANGWEQYEISNYCRPGFMAKHNTGYWQNKPYIGFGPSAHSYNGIERLWNVAEIEAYYYAIENSILPIEKEILTDIQKCNEYIMTQLRTCWGIQLAKILKYNFKMEGFNEHINTYLSEQLITKENGFIKLTKEGKMFADSIAGSLFF